MSNELTRREVIKGAAAVAVGATLASQVKATEGSYWQTTNRLRFGIIGAGGKGWSGMELAAAEGDIVALCDVDVNNRLKAMAQHPNAASFQDYRKMLDLMHDEIDAVVISIPDHHHYPASMIAMGYGLHSYTEKPLARTVWEIRRMAELARKKGVATQMGNQSTANTPMRKVAKVIRQGHFGQAKEVHVWTDRPSGWWPQGVERPAPADPPKTLDWNIWLGPRPERPYAPGYHPFAWRGWWDFGTGALGDMGCHIFNMPFMALDLRDPESIQATTSGHNRDSFPLWSIVNYHFPKRGSRGPVELTWYDGGKRPDPKLCPDKTYGGNGVIVVCENATIYSPNSENMEFSIVGGGEIPDVEVEESPGHMAEFARAARGGEMCVGNFP
ncbi:MAG TPA: Gfo/Idh/MocA family oxidoreductase, partial [Fimbriimonadaceae bacterium]|nr:Gfo/Idh/MocA family oxidoreductase [Fimbriimonadaceae bacterium]